MMSGRHIYELRQRLAITQEEFAHLIGVTVSTVNRWENGHNTPSRLARRVMHELASPPTNQNWKADGSERPFPLARAGDANPA